MKKLFSLLIILFLVFLSGQSLAANKIRAFIDTDGGSPGDLDAISCLDLTTNDLGLVFRVSDASMLFYYYDSTGTDPEELTNYTIIEPDDVDANCSGNGNWILFQSFTFAGSSTPTLNFKDSDQAHQTIASIAANATDANDSTVTFGVEEDTSVTTYITLDGVNEQVTFAKPISVTVTKEDTFTLLDPADGDDPLVKKFKEAVTITGLDCVTLGGGDIDVDMQECDANGANCASGGIALTDVTTTNQNDASFTDAAFDANDYMKMVLTNQAGTTDQLSCTVTWTETL